MDEFPALRISLGGDVECEMDGWGRDNERVLLTGRASGEEIRRCEDEGDGIWEEVLMSGA
ncbi:uncharacterized protein RCO7_14203 [Rhynchosporium graminicola]|uniref:Uncharacterized protein n=1 Tax=Rhynchosporium graminicola TaxID=2792576 RepID=A0A1E1JZD2_9HELO|nr:uncharacterized protein RCO7_14203 [Rhynchosporium commune]